MKRKIYSVILSVAIACGILLSGCDGLFGGYVKISSIENLYAMASNKSYELTCDIDLEGREWFPLAVKNFNGNGYTIKNCHIIQTTENYACGFFTEAKSLKNVVFDSIQGSITFTERRNGGYYSSYNAGGLVVGKAKEISDIEITNSKLFVTTSLNDDADDNVYCGMIAGYIDGEIVNSKVDNCELKCSRFYSTLNVGGIAGTVSGDESEDVTDNTLENSKIYADADTLNCGGIIGFLCVSASGCVVKNNIFELRAYPIHTSSRYYSCVGGIVGCSAKDNEIKESVSSSNEITLSRISRDTTYSSKYEEGGYVIGGIIGTSRGIISNCLSDSNNLNGSTESTSSKQFARVGGLCGSASATILKSIAQYNKISGTNSVVSSNMFSTGFVAKTSATITNCAAYNNSVTGGDLDAFTGKVDDLLFNCYITEKDESLPNTNSLPVLSSNEWNNIINILSLDSLWYIEDGNLYLR